MHISTDGAGYAVGGRARAAGEAAVPRDLVNLPPACNTGVKSGGFECDAIKLLDVGVDYLHLTAVQDAGVEQLYYLASEVGTSLEETGDRVKQSSELGYRGHAVGRHLFYGQSQQGAFLRASSVVGAKVMDLVRTCGDRSFRATRVDFQATVKYAHPPGRGFFRAFSDASHEASRNIRDRRTRPWQVALLDEYGRGDTVYLGSRSSENYGRLYDKGREMPEQYELGSVRFETEHKGSAALRLFDKVADGDDVPAFVAGYVSAWFESRGIPFPVDVAAVELLRTVEHYSDAERQLKWLREGVMPTIARLVAAGRRDDLLALLADAGLELEQ